MRPIDHLVLASYENPQKWTVRFEDGIEFTLWASNPGQARIIGKLRRRAEGYGQAHISCVMVEQ